jgi:glycerophosphoryl diester phosphodiesterase
MQQPARHFELSGHRGARGLWPENTLAGFAGALALGVDAIELDVTLSHDGKIVVSHDLALNPDLTRGPDGVWLVAPTPVIHRVSAAELRRFDVGRARPGSAVALAHPCQRPADGERIPLLSEVFACVAKNAVILDVELKTDFWDWRSVDPTVLADAVLVEADRAGMLGRLALRSFDWRGLRHARRRFSTLPLAYLTDAADAAALAMVRREAGGAKATWAPRYSGLRLDLVAEAHGCGLSVKPWTVNDPADMARLIAWNVDGFCTDRPDLARGVMAQADLRLPAAFVA